MSRTDTAIDSSNNKLITFNHNTTQHTAITKLLRLTRYNQLNVALADVSECHLGSRDKYHVNTQME